MQILDEIESGAASDEMSIGTLLRKYQILVARLGSERALDWVSWELNGYPDLVDVPSYRELPITVKANMASYSSQISNWVVPPMLLGEFENQLTKLEYRPGVGAIEDVVDTNEVMIAFQLGDLPLILQSLKFTEMKIHAAWGETSRSSVRNILESVRNRILSFVLDIRTELPELATSAKVPENAGEQATQSFVNNIYGSANFVTAGRDANVSHSFNHGDLEALKAALQKESVPDVDIVELEKALKLEPSTVNGQYGPKVAAWMGNMIQKAASGSWDISVAAAGGVLATLISRFYGI